MRRRSWSRKPVAATPGSQHRLGEQVGGVLSRGHPVLEVAEEVVGRGAGCSAELGDLLGRATGSMAAGCPRRSAERSADQVIEVHDVLFRVGLLSPAYLTGSAH